MEMIEQNLQMNPQWNFELTISIPDDLDPILRIVNNYCTNHKMMFVTHIEEVDEVERLDRIRLSTKTKSSLFNTMFFVLFYWIELYNRSNSIWNTVSRMILHHHF